MRIGGWRGEWVQEALGLSLRPTPDSAAARLRRMMWLALRRNPRRAHLVVSPVLGKHVPVDPRIVLVAGRALAASLRERLPPGRLLVVGLAETATALGHIVAVELGADYVHSTRRRLPDGAATLRFVEAHSHATEHRVLADSRYIAAAETVVLVDDELSTGGTARAAIESLSDGARSSQHRGGGTLGPPRRGE